MWVSKRNQRHMQISIKVIRLPTIIHNPSWLSIRERIQVFTYIKEAIPRFIQLKHHLWTFSQTINNITASRKTNIYHPNRGLLEMQTSYSIVTIIQMFHARAASKMYLPRTIKPRWIKTITWEAQLILLLKTVSMKVKDQATWMRQLCLMRMKNSGLTPISCLHSKMRAATLHTK